MAKRRRRKKRKQKAEPSARQLLAPFLIWVVLSCVMLYFLVTHRTLHESDFEQFKGTPSSVTVLKSSNKGQPFVEIRLPEDPIRYRIPVEVYKDMSDTSGFLRAAQAPGAELSFYVERGARQHPDKPAIDPKPTVFIDAVSVGSREYYSLRQRIAWDESNQLALHILIVVFPLLTAYMGWQLWLRRTELDKPDPR